MIILDKCVNFWVKFKYWRKFWMRSVEERWSIFRLQASHCSTDLIKIVRIPANDAPPQEFLHNPMQMSPCNGFQTVAVACNWALSRGRFVSRVDRLYNEYFLTARGFAFPSETFATYKGDEAWNFYTRGPKINF